ncbi:MAG: 30S ribosomal protein S12 methylthiotransferase RimO [Planctomycetaceae bacterium]|jgi:ribosomal protein S12 methylthiotransferase|nr:30S ribosomal protein S12 methylthiotransferase RimO [Planctomycetaceae bacterium]
MNETSAKTFSIVSLGCPKNLVDSEYYVQEMKQAGFEFRTELDGCETVILNTCGFLRSARDEARKYLDALIELKNQGQIRRIVVRGCMPKFEGIEKLAAEFPDVDEWFGIPNSAAPKNVSFNRREILTEKHVAYLRIADGCDRRCTFCAIPNIRGAFRSEPMESLLEEARQLAAAGVRELIVIAQETTFWGTDLYGKPQLTRLLREIERIEGIRWIRVMYAYPQFFDDELIELFVAGGKGEGKLLPYIDIPLQHAGDEILYRMNRRVTKAETEKLLGKLRERIDSLVLRTSLIVGFPGETDELFEELLKFVETWKFERAGVFPFSAEAGTPAANFGNRVPQRVIERRFERLYKVCEKYSIGWAVCQKGRILNVQIDGNYFDELGRKESDLFIGRTFADAPDIDPVVYVTGEHLEHGSLISCEILENEGCDLVGITI